MNILNFFQGHNKQGNWEIAIKASMDQLKEVVVKLHSFHFILCYILKGLFQNFPFYQYMTEGICSRALYPSREYFSSICLVKEQVII